MEFIMKHISWIFSGIGVSALGLLAKYVIRKCQKKTGIRGESSGIEVKKSTNIEITQNENTDILLSNCDRVRIEGNKYGER